MTEKRPADPPTSLARLRPAEDSGASTSGYYEYQYGWVARHALEMSDPKSDLQWILCEWHTDFILGWSDSFAPVSVKHREANSGRWTVATLFGDGGMLTLYRRWDELGRPEQCRWVTNGGLDVDCRELAKACAAVEAAALEEFLDKHQSRFTGASRADALAFLTALRIDNKSSRAEDQRVVQIDECARPALRRLGLGTLECATVYDAVVDRARKASQGFGKDEPSSWSNSDVNAFDAAVLAAADSAHRVIRGGPIREMAKTLAEPAGAQLPLPPPTDTTMIRKLQRGKVVPTVDNTARRSRMNWTTFETTYSEPIPVDGQPSTFDSLRARVTSEALDAQLAAHNDETPYGNQMHADVRARMTAVASEPSQLSGLTTDLLMGLAYDLTARCEIWWSERFDPDAEDSDGVVGSASGGLK